MAKIFITGSADGLGSMAARLLISQGHEVMLHARNEDRAKHALKQNPKASHCLTGDLSILSQTKELAGKVNDAGTLDAIIYNAAIGYREPKKILTKDGLATVFAVNSLAPYILTALINRPGRLIYLSSSLHHQGNVRMDDLNWEKKSWSGYQAYADSKLHDLLLAFAVARKWPDVYSNGLDPGWVPTKMGGPGAPDDLRKGAETQAWLAVSEEPEAKVNGKYFFHKLIRRHNMVAADSVVQDEFLAACAVLSGVNFQE
ncbi:SDR family NAD(P)-dependent oxidoreductase [Flavitalea sp.]|nr:SDR family NAD(P)-dependent oxidoreductase [Flavitalea sp.]